jgi:hypothetical protein
VSNEMDGVCGVKWIANSEASKTDSSTTQAGAFAGNEREGKGAGSFRSE